MSEIPIYWRNWREEQLAAYQQDQGSSNHCAKYAAASGLNMLFGVVLTGDDLTDWVESRPLKGTGKYTIFGNHNGSLVYQTANLVRELGRQAGLPILVKRRVGQVLDLLEALADENCLTLVTLTYKKLRKLADFVNEGIPYIATHPDINCPTPNGFIPDIGAMMAMIEASTGKKPDLIIGKPHTPMVEAVVTLTGHAPGQLTMVGDRLYTDIAMGAAGIQTVLVLSGETQKADLPDAPCQPDLICENLGELLEVLRGEK